MSELYIGLMSGTSMDGIDAALVRFDEASLEILCTGDYPYPATLRTQLLDAIAVPLEREIDNVNELNVATGECFRDAALALLAAAGVDASEVTAIGSHGQTLRHQPDHATPFTLQIGAPDLIANGTGITTVADFRRADIAAGGQGAPLAPVFHDWLFRRPGVNRGVLNIGGIANITLLAEGEATIGFDTGPGNSLLDRWTHKHRGESFDRNGAWAASGEVNEVLLQRLLSDPYFAAPPPKSTGFEHFNMRWLEERGVEAFAPADVQATLCALSARTIAEAIICLPVEIDELLVCGGGVHNRALMQALQDRLPGIAVKPTTVAGLDPDWVEACAFAWLAMRRLNGLPGNLPSVTGARKKVQLGCIHRSS